MVDRVPSRAEIGREPCTCACRWDPRALGPRPQLLRTGKESSVIAAAGALEKLAFGDEQRLLLADAGAIPPLVQLLR